ncbi:hypothetical protein B0H13DRAFT_1898668 [Mycena leptocephala]|nr:hypothetical protein B0H13DRAFT_1898668 [Mycena leptocephala]
MEAASHHTTSVPLTSRRSAGGTIRHNQAIQRNRLEPYARHAAPESSLARGQEIEQDKTQRPAWRPPTTIAFLALVEQNVNTFCNEPGEAKHASVLLAHAPTIRRQSGVSSGDLRGKGPRKDCWATPNAKKAISKTTIEGRMCGGE